MKSNKKNNNKSSSTLQIVGEDGVKKDNSKIIISIGAILITALVIVAACLFMKFSNKPKVATNTDASNEEYDKAKEMYATYNIDYSYEDYLKDKAAREKKKQEKDDKKSKKEDQGAQIINDDMSDASRQFVESNDDILDEAAEDTGVEIDSQQLAQSIIDQTHEMNEFIDGHLGWNGNEYSDSQYDYGKKLIDNIVKSCQTGENPDPDGSYSIGADELRGVARYCIYNKFQYLEDYDEYYDTLKQWLAMGHPNINNIYNITVTSMMEDDSDSFKFDDNIASISVDIITDNGSYHIYLVSYSEDNGISTYKILDIQ